MRRTLSFLFTGLIAVVLLTVASLTSNSPASAATTIAPTTTCANGVDNSGGLGMICQVTIINTITASGSSADVTVRECHGAAGDPNAACSTHQLDLGSAVTKVNQCNDSINGGGGTLRCRVKVTNRFIGLTRTKTAVTVNQCVGSGNPGAHTSGCDPFPAATTNATVTQCNGSANGDTLVGLTCTVTGTQTSSNNYVKINQCNGSANGGGALVICSANITNVIVPAATPRPTAAPTVQPTPKPTPAPGATPGPTTAPGPNITPRPTAGPLPPTNTELGTDSTAGGSGPLVPAGVLLLVGLALVGWYRRSSWFKARTRTL